MTLSDEEKKEIRAAYFRDYYSKNKEELAKKRKEKYSNDPEYREKIRIRSVALRDKKKAEYDRLLALGLVEKKTYKKRGPRTYTVVVNGVSQPAFSIAEMAKKLNRSKFVVMDWIKRGVIPKSPIRTKKGFGLYTDNMIEAISKAIVDKVTIFNKDNLGDIILGFWKDCNIGELNNEDSTGQ
jgi:hypothetical protein